VPKSKVNKEFSRFAQQYQQYNVIQTQVAKKLVSSLKSSFYTQIVDMGCGTGTLYQTLLSQNIGFEYFLALDFSAEMLAEHPSHLKVKKIQMDFNHSEDFGKWKLGKGDILLSSSALQWSKDLDFTFSHIAKDAQNIHLALFTSGTFTTLHQSAGISSPIYSALEIQTSLSKYYEASYEVENYKLYFKSVIEMFRYIKKSGVSGGKKRLSLKQMRALMQDYPLNYLEFEVLFIRAKRL